MEVPIGYSHAVSLFVGSVCLLLFVFTVEIILPLDS